MRQPGSILIVVLGLLAILAVVGITFVTMSSIDRNTAANFALQTQFDLAADGTVEFVCHALTQDLWELKNRTYTTMLMSGINNNEPWDAPGTDDPWLADTVEPATAGSTPKNLSFGGRAFTLYTLPFRGMATSMPADAPDNLGTGLANAKNGIWIPELAFPYESGLIRVSITIQDHASLINLNAHGNSGADTQYWPLADLVGWGYFISDVNPGFDPEHMGYLLTGVGTQPGRWSKPNGKRAPGNPNVGEILFENPGAAVPWNWNGDPAIHATEGDYPLNLDEEFDLRRIPRSGDPTFSTRIQKIIPSLVGDPNRRLAYTTVGWTSEARGDPVDAHLAAKQGNPTEGDWSARKGDLNFDDPKAIYSALYYGRTCPIGTSWGAQFAANVIGFRDGTTATGCGIKGYDLGSMVGTTKVVSASRQPILSKVSALSSSNSSGGFNWTVTVQVVSPWDRDTALQTTAAGLTTTNMKVQVNGADIGTLTNPMPAMAASPQTYTSASISGGASQLLADAVNSVTIIYRPANFDTDIILDQLENADIALLAASPQGGIYRPIFTEPESRGTNDLSPTTVLYVGPWAAGAGNINTFAMSTKDKTSGIPIRFPRSVDGLSSNLPPRAPAAGSPFKAIARLGDIDQILCPPSDKGPADFWPWVPRVAKAAANANALTADTEANYKFNWASTTDNPTPAPGGSNVSRLNAANVLAIGGPWQDKIDNDGDYKKDADDAGTGNTTTDSGRFAGPELRVAGKVNLNTATTLTFQAMESGLRLPQGCLSSLAAASTRKVFKSTAEVRSTLPTMPYDQTTNPNARGPLEQRDEAFNRISNIASVRSDTYSIYGTVQYLDVARMRAAGRTTATAQDILRQRRFWALVDRSPSLAYLPTYNTFIHPRILNFQWMN